MKNFIIFLLVVAIIAGMGYGAYKYLFDYEETYIDDVVAKGPLLYIKGSNIKDNIDRMGATKLWKNISSINYRKVMFQAGVPKSKIVMVHNVVTSLGSEPTQQILKYFFNDEVAIILYPSEMDFSKVSIFSEKVMAKVIESVLSNVGIVFRAGKEVQFIELMSQALGNLGVKVEREAKPYNEHTLYVLKLTTIGIEIVYAKIDDLIIAGAGDIIAKKSLDVIDGKIESLSEDEQFAKASKKFYFDSDLELYVDLVQTRNIIHSQTKVAMSLLGNKSKDASSKVDRKVDMVFKQLDGFQAATASTKWEGLFQSSFTMLFDQSKLAQGISKSYACPASKNTSLDFIPENVVAYQWSNCLDLFEVWGEMKKEMASLPEGEGARKTQIDNVQKSLGISIEKDIVPAFAGEIGGYINSISMGYIFPIPEMLFFVEVRDKGKAKQLLNRVANIPLFEVKEEIYGGTTYSYIKTPFGEIVEPSFCFLNKHLLIAVKQKVLKASIDAYSETALSIESNPGFRTINVGLTDANKAIQYLEFPKLLGDVKKVVNWKKDKNESKDKKRNAFKGGAQTRLDEQRDIIASLKSEIEVLENEFISLEDEIWDIESIGQDVSQKRLDLKEVGEKLKSKKNELKSSIDQEVKIEQSVKSLGQDTVPINFENNILDGVILPILNGLETVRSMGTRMTIDSDKGIIEANLIADISE